MVEVILFAAGCVGGYYGARAILRARQRRQISRWAAIPPPDREDSLKSKLAALQAKYAKGTEAWND